LQPDSCTPGRWAIEARRGLPSTVMGWAAGVGVGLGVDVGVGVLVAVIVAVGDGVGDGVRDTVVAVAGPGRVVASSFWRCSSV